MCICVCGGGAGAHANSSLEIIHSNSHGTEDHIGDNIFFFLHIYIFKRFYKKTLILMKSYFVVLKRLDKYLNFMSDLWFSYPDN